MNKKIIKLLSTIALLGSATSVNATNLWTANIENIYVYSDGKAKVFLTNLNSPHPNNENKVSTGCTTNGVWLAPNVSSERASPELLSFSLTMFSSKVPVRIAIVGQGADCYVINIGSQR